MAAFRFPWQTLLNWKRNLEELSQMRLAAKAGQLQKEEERIQVLAARRRATEEEVSKKAQRGIRADEFALYKEFAEVSRLDLQKREERRRITLREMEDERDALIRVTKEKKILEKLKEKKLKDFVEEEEKSEQKYNDERVTLRYRKR
jgi:flagellar protein FliJ